MAKVTLRASGGLNSDIDPNNLPEGDYVAANNIIFDAGKDGGAGAIKMLDSIKTTGVTFTEDIIETFQNADGYIYVLVKATSGGTASIYRIPSTLDSKELIVTYSHNLADANFKPDIKVIGDNVVWNYAESGTVMSFYLKRAFSETAVAVSDLKLAKSTPNNVVTIKKVVSGTAIEVLESTDFQFASRYRYDSGEYSVLSNFSQMFKGEKGTSKYLFSYNFASRPAFASEIELFVRQGNTGTWRRADTQKVSSTNVSDVEWTNETFESLDSIASATPFHTVPVSAKHIEIAKNRVFLANIQDDYVADGAEKLLIQTAAGSGYQLGTSGTAKSYISGLTGSNYSATSTESTYDGSDYAKPFANNSTYAVGIMYLDSAMKTRGVEAYSKITTGKFAYPILPSISVTPQTGWVKPSWAKYAQLVYTKNLAKSYIFEGFASNIFFELNVKQTNEKTKEVTTVSVLSQSVTNDQLQNVKYLVVDLMGMWNAGKIYTYQDGDKITISTNSGTLLDLNIVGQNNNLIYCLYSGAALSNPAIPDPSKLFFEIYTPKQVQEDESLVFYEYGNLVDLTTNTWTIGTAFTFTGAGTLSNTKLIGDMVFSYVDLPSYATSPFVTNYIKDETVDMAAARTEVRAAFSTETLGLTATRNTSNIVLNNNLAMSVSPIFTNIGTNEDGAIIKGDNDIAASSGKYFALTGFYEIGKQVPDVSTVTIDYKLKAVQTLAIAVPATGNPSGSMTWKLTSQMYRVPYNNITNLYEPPVKFGQEYQVAEYTYVNNITSYEDAFARTQVIDLSSDLLKDIQANDKFYIVLGLSMTTDGVVSNASVSIVKQPSYTYGVELVFKGNRKASKAITSYNNNAKLNDLKTKFIIRTISNSTTDPQWNTSAGKAFLKNTFNTNNIYRTNTIRYGGNYVAGTKINNINAFNGLDSNDVAIENGEITSLQRASRLQGNGSMMLVLCQRECAYIMLGEQELSQGNNSALNALSANMIGTIRNFGNNLGMVNKTSVMNYKGIIWWWDDFNKKIVKYTPDGLELPSDTFMRSFFRGKSGVAAFAYDPFHNMAFVSFTGDTQSMGYSDNLKRWISAYDFVAPHAESYGDRMIIFKNKVVYKSLESNNKTDYNAFLGASAVNSNISLMLNSRVPVNPLNVAVWHNMNVIDWSKAADVDGTRNFVKDNLLQIDITNENGQATLIREGNFIVEDNRLYAHVMRNTNTPNVDNPLIQGDYIVGYLNKFVVTLKDKTQNMRINSIDVEVASVSGHS